MFGAGRTYGLLCVLELLRCADAKVLMSASRLEPNNRWQYLTKFGYGIGTGTYGVRVRLPTGAAPLGADGIVGVHLYLDEEWSQAELRSPCERANSARRTWQLPLKASGEWSEIQTGELMHRMRPHIWYFAMSSCVGSLPNNTADVEVEFHAHQEDGSEFSVESKYTMGVECVALVCLSVFLLYYASRCTCFYQSADALHPVIWVLTVALMLQFAASVSYLAHLRQYHKDGVGYNLLDSLAENLLMGSQVMHTTLLIVIAQGYTLLHSTIDNLDVMKPVAALVMLTHTLLVGFDKMQDSSNKNFEGEGVVGWILLVIRLLLFAWFARSLASTRAAGGLRLQTFLKRFEIVGSIYFLAYPVIFIVVQAFAPYLRQPIMQMGVVAMQLSSTAWLASLFLSRGAYFEVSTINTVSLPSPRTGKLD
jgi:hypothetical protein